MACKFPSFQLLAGERRQGPIFVQHHGLQRRQCPQSNDHVSWRLTVDCGTTKFDVAVEMGPVLQQFTVRYSRNQTNNVALPQRRSLQISANSSEFVKQRSPEFLDKARKSVKSLARQFFLFTMGQSFTLVQYHSKDFISTIS